MAKPADANSRVQKWVEVCLSLRARLQVSGLCQGRAEGSRGLRLPVGVRITLGVSSGTCPQQCWRAPRALERIAMPGTRSVSDCIQNVGTWGYLHVHDEIS